MSDTTAQTTGEQTHLWEIDHDYYCSEGDYSHRGMAADYSTWGSFLESEGGNDLDLNLLFRWDWLKRDEGVMGELQLFFCLQRKAAQRSVHVLVHPDEEPLVRVYLQERFEHLLKLWQPLTLAGA